VLDLPADRVRALLPWGALIDAVREIFRNGCEMPVRHHHTIEVPGDADATLLLMPAWLPNAYLGIKVATIFPGNAARGQDSVSASYILMNGRTGETLAIIDGGELTARRTAATSVLAASFLARADATSHLVVGTGRMAANLAAAYASVRQLRLTVWGRNPDKARSLAGRLSDSGIRAGVATDLATAATEADIITTCTLSVAPLISGAWLRPGAHLDLVGGFRPDMREADDEAVRRASIFVDTSEITMFKSVGASLEDLAGAVLAYENARR
jgi:alanine dehydrogenase